MTDETDKAFEKAYHEQWEDWHVEWDKEGIPSAVCDTMILAPVNLERNYKLFCTGYYRGKGSWSEIKMLADLNGCCLALEEELSDRELNDIDWELKVGKLIKKLNQFDNEANPNEFVKGVKAALVHVKSELGEGIIS